MDDDWFVDPLDIDSSKYESGSLLKISLALFSTFGKLG